MNMNALLEAQKDFEGIEKFISGRFGIPMDARIMVHGLDAANLGERPDPAALKQMADTAEEFLDSGSPLDLKLPGATGFDRENPPKVVTLVSYIRNAATGAMTHGDEFGIGDSQAYRNREPGSMAGFSTRDIRIGNLLKPDTYPTELKNYVAMLSRQFLPGILRIAFDELNLMAYLVKAHPEIATYMTMLPSAEDPESLGKFSYGKLDFFGKTVVPVIVVRELISRSQPGKFRDKTTYCDPSTLAETRAYLGDDVTDMFVDYIDPPQVNLDANLADRDGKGELSLGDLVDAMDIGDDTGADTIRKRTRNAEGKDLRFVPDADKEDEKEHELFSRSSDDELECPAYKAGEWYVVQVADEKHSMHGWFSMQESPSGRFYFRGGPDPHNFDDGSGYGTDTWCIVKWDDYFYRYCSASNNDYAYYYVHESACRIHSIGQDHYAATAFGVVYSGTDAPESNLWLGLARSNQDRANNPAVGTKELFNERVMEFFPMKPTNQLTAGKYDLRYSLNNTIGMLCLIGQWDNTVRGEENILKTAQELSLKWFPPKPGVELSASSVRYATARDADEAASILSLVSSGRDVDDEGILDKLKMHRFTINVGDIQWAMISSPDDMKKEGNFMFIPYDELEGYGATTPALAFRYDPDADPDRQVTPITDSPVPIEQAIREVKSATQHPATREEPGSDTVDGMYLAPAFGGVSGKRRVAIGNDGTTLYAVGPDTDGRPVPLGHLPGQLDARQLLGRRATYFTVEGGYNVCVGRNQADTGNSPIKYIGFAREGKKNIQFLSVKLVLQDGNLLLEMPGSGNLRLANMRGDLMRQREDRYGAFLFYIDGRTVVDGVNLTMAALSRLATDHSGDIGMVTISGDFMANLAGDGLVGTVDWFDSVTLSPRGQSRLTAGMLNREARETPSVINL